ncbi:MAG TPA: C45 family autoproteolytic acyltransferase/hydrolase [Clostridia bacterium]|nr:C45 family autoproteolytic acyltransferase/hydrolase [Clostridia bacterium]
MQKLRCLDLSGPDGHFRYGQAFGEAIRAFSADRPLRPSFLRMKQKAEARYPAYCKEIYDRAAGAGANGDLLFAAMLDGVKELESCTDIFIRKADGSMLYGHNEDGEYTPGNCALARYSGLKVGFTEFSAIGSMPGYTFLWNDAGLITSVNYIHHDEMRPEEPSAHFLLRDAAEASCIEEIRGRLAGKSCASAFHLNVFDTKSRRAYSVEQLFEQTDILEVTDRYAHTNHLLRLGTGYASPGWDTKPRLASARRMLAPLDPARCALSDIRAILDYTDGEDRLRSVYSDPALDAFPTAATMLVDSASGEIVVIDRFCGEELRFGTPSGRD